MSVWTGPYPRVSEALITIFTNTVVRWGEPKEGLQLDRPCNTNSNEQCRSFYQDKDSVAFISWCADKIEYWSTPDFNSPTHQCVRLGETKLDYRSCHGNPDRMIFFLSSFRVNPFLET